MANEQKPALVPEFAPILLGKRGMTPHDDEACKKFPVLMQLLLPKYDASHRLSREPGVISVRVDGPLFRVTVVCPTEGVQTTYETPSFGDLMRHLEAYVANPGSPWVPTYDKKKRTGQGLKSVVDSIL